MGINDKMYATSALGEVLEQLYMTDQYHVLMCIDGISDWFRPSKYRSFRYYQERRVRGNIPPHDIALVRMFMRFDGHRMRNGYKLMSTTQYRYHGHTCTPEMLNWYPNYSHEVQGLPLDDFRKAMEFLYLSGWMSELFDETKIESYHMESQGNMGAFI